MVKIKTKKVRIGMKGIILLTIILFVICVMSFYIYNLIILSPLFAPPEIIGPWTNSLYINITLSCSDPNSESMCNVTRYCNSNIAGCEPIAIYEGETIQVSQEGYSYLRYYSLDSATNSEDINSFVVRIDRTKPITTDNAPLGLQNSSFEIKLTGEDSLSGINYTSYRINSGSWTSGNSISISSDGNYTIEYYSVDNAGNAEDIKIINVILNKAVADIIPPIITLNGEELITIYQGSSYNELGATVTDNIDVGLTATISGSVNTNVIGSYTIIYSAVDNSGNVATLKTRTVNVIAVPDTNAPIISNIVGTTSTNSATISWTTDEDSNSSVIYGNSSSLLDLNVVDSSFVKAHLININGLDSGATYYYRVGSCDAVGNCNTGEILNFVTQNVSVCVKGYPTLSISPQAQSGENGTLKTYNLNVINNDNSACGDSNFLIETSTPLSGWIYNFDNPVLIAPGSSVTNTFSVKSSNSAVNGNYSIKINVNNTNNLMFGSIYNINYEVLVPIKTCTIGWICQNSSNKIYQLLNCDVINSTFCRGGCSAGVCQPYCGDGSCSNGESCSSCSIDCGNCTTSSGGGGGGGGGGGSVGASRGSGLDLFSNVNMTNTNTTLNNETNLSLNNQTNSSSISGGSYGGSGSSSSSLSTKGNLSSSSGKNVNSGNKITQIFASKQNRVLMVISAVAFCLICFALWKLIKHKMNNSDNN